VRAPPIHPQSSIRRPACPDPLGIFAVFPDPAPMPRYPDARGFRHPDEEARILAFWEEQGCSRRA